MPRRRQANATERARDRRYRARELARRRLERIMREMRRSLHRMLSETADAISEIRELRNWLRLRAQQLQMYGRRYALARAFLEALAIQIFGDIIYLNRSLRLFSRELVNRIMYPDMDMQFFNNSYNRVHAGAVSAETVHMVIAKYWQERGAQGIHMLTQHFSFVDRNGTRINLVLINRPLEYRMDPWILPANAYLWTNPRCASTHGLAFLDFTPGQHLYVVDTVVKANEGVPNTNGVFAANLMLTWIDKPEGEQFTITLDTQEDFKDTNQQITIAVDDLGRVRIMYPLYFVMERPSRVIDWRARNMGRREQRDFMSSCSVYRLMMASKRRKYRELYYKGKVFRMRIPLTITYD